MQADLREQVDKLIADYSEAEGTSVKRALIAEIKRFASYILAANTTVSPGEPEFLSELLGREITAVELANYISAENVHSDEFATTIPSLYRKHIQDAALSACYVQVFIWIGKEAVISDNKADAVEVDAFSDYITMLCDFYKAENPESPISFSHDIKGAFENITQGAGPEEEETLEELLAELDGLIGLHSVKKNVHSLLHLQEIQMEREKRGLAKIPMSNHLVFTGNPGTGKTTVARLIARIYHKIGLLSTGTLVEVDRSGMVAGYVGQTAIEVKNVMDSAKGGVLFIDEAYSLATGLQGDYGMEVRYNPAPQLQIPFGLQR